LPRISILGLFPTLQGIAVQLVTLLVLLAGFVWNRRSARLAAA
jgi:high-affinity iron transporter